MQTKNMNFLMPFLSCDSSFRYVDYDYPLTAFEKLTDVFRSEHSKDSDPRVGIPFVLAHCYPELFEDIGFLYFPIKGEEGETILHLSGEHTLGWAVKVISPRHVIFEIGDNDHHVRIDMKETWIGHRLAYQIDQVTLWDGNGIYDIPCAEGEDSKLFYGILGTIDLTVQALQNGDDEEGVIAFKELEHAKNGLQPIIRINSFDKMKACP